MANEVSWYLSAASLWLPERPFPRDDSAVHVPFGFWLIEALRPRLVIGIGSRTGSLHAAFAHAVHRLDLGSLCQSIELIDKDEEAVSTAREASRAEDQIRNTWSLEDNASHLRLDQGTALGRYSGHSIDLLHLSSPAVCRLIESRLTDWLERMSASGMVLLSGTSGDEPDSGARRLFERLGQSYPSFGFTYGGGLGVVGVGSRIPSVLMELLSISSEPERADRLARLYQRLGQGFVDRLARAELETRCDRVEAELAVMREEQGRIGPIREQNACLLDENARLDDERRVLTEDLRRLETEQRELTRRLEWLHHSREGLVAELNEIQQSLGWTLVKRVRRARAVLLPEAGVRGKCWRLLKRGVRSMMVSGPRGTANKLAAKVRRKIGLPARTGAKPVVVPRSSSHPAASGRRFEDLGWVYTGDSRSGSGRGAGHKILLIGHSACRTGAPLCFLRLARELARAPGVDCWIVLQKGGDLQDDFARVAPTLEASRLVESGIPVERVPQVVASLFRDYATRGVAICNTVAVSQYHEALAACEIPVLSWIHELPTMVDLFGGRPAIEAVDQASTRIVVPARIVREAWIRRFDIDPDKIQVLNYGVDAITRHESRHQHRLRVRKELGIPEDGLLVLGCGTADLRKGADLFTQLAGKVLTAGDHPHVLDKTWFIWVGDRPLAMLHQWLAHDTALKGLQDRVRFVGERRDMAPYFAAADVFALTSREDPCPFANLEAMESGLPVVVFEGAGGAPEVIGSGGIAVPYLDVEAMAGAVVDLLAHEDKRCRMGRLGSEIICRDFSWASFMERFHQILRESFGLFPPRDHRVSVIVPNYRHAPYLEERLNSIFRQTVLPHEILVLDDASPDDSVSIVERLMPRSPVPIRLVVNPTNSGSTFRQWIKGIELASGDLIWLAESDDSCHPEFLERLIPEFHDPDVVLAYCQSELIGPDGAQLSPHFLGHTDDLSPNRWRRRYCVPGAVEVEHALSQKNTIPNASAMLFRRPRRLDFLQELFDLRFAGDWLFHAMLCRDGKVAYLPEVLNRYRRHEQTVSHHAVRSDTYLSETLRVKRRVFEAFEVSAQAITQSVAQTVFEHRWLESHRGQQALGRPLNAQVRDHLAAIGRLIQDRRRPRSALRVLLILDGLSPELASVAGVQLANALSEHHVVFVCNARPDVCDPAVVARFHPEVLFIEGGPGPLNWMLARQETTSWVHSATRSEILAQLAEAHAIDVIDARLGGSDELAARLQKRLNLPCLRSSARNASLIGFDANFLTELRAGKACGSADVRIATAAGRFPGWFGQAVATAVRVVNRLPASERGGGRLRTISQERPSLLGSLAARICDLSTLDRLRDSDALIFPDPADPDQEALLVAALGSRIAVIAPDCEHVRMMLDENRAAAILLPLGAGNRFDLDDLVTALQGLFRPAWLAPRLDAAESLFRSRYSSERVAQAMSDTYHQACSSRAARRDRGHPGSAPPYASSPARQAAGS